MIYTPLYNGHLPLHNAYFTHHLLSLSKPKSATTTAHPLSRFLSPTTISLLVFQTLPPTKNPTCVSIYAIQTRQRDINGLLTISGRTYSCDSCQIWMASVEDVLR